MLVADRVESIDAIAVGEDLLGLGHSGKGGLRRSNQLSRRGLTASEAHPHFELDALNASVCKCPAARTSLPSCIAPFQLGEKVAHCGGRVTLNLILASWSGALPILRRNGSQRGSEWILSNRFSTTISENPGS